MGSKMKIQNICKLCLMAIVGFFLCSNIEAGELPWEKALPFENATIHYSVSGMGHGEEIVYVRDYGKEQATYLDSITKIMGMAVRERSVEIVDVDFVYSYDLEAQEGTKNVNPQKYMVKAYANLTAEEKNKVQKNAIEMGGTLAEGMGGVLQQNAIELLGFGCDKIDMMGGGVIYLLHGTNLPLKAEMNMMGMKTSIVATSIDIGAVDPKYFMHPKGIVAIVDLEGDAMAETMGVQIINALKDPKAAKKGFAAAVNGARLENMAEEDKQKLEQGAELLKGIQNIFGQ